MDLSKKEKLLNEAKAQIRSTISTLHTEIQKIEPAIATLEKALKRSASEERDRAEALYYHHLEEKKILSELEKSPYFVRCDLQFESDTQPKTIYFGKFSNKDNSIYSWVTPAASIRFDAPGKFEFKGNDEEKVTGNLFRKDNFMIVDSNLLFMSTESVDSPRTLIYQEHFTKQKSEFMLPEIVEQMEKVQDKIIRSHYFGSYLISGPAGSGKTTLALHRVAYLLQSPDTEKLVSPTNTVVFVQDIHTRNYFSKLLPDLGIHNVKVTTFDEWALELLEIKDVTFQLAYIEDESIRDSYEHSKNTALQNIAGYTFETNIFNLLYYIYRDHMSPTELNLFLQQSKNKVIDRFDLAALLKTKKQAKGFITHKAPSYKRMKNGKYKRTFVDDPLTYSLIVIDEAENYLKENVELIKSCISPKTQSIMYVGDLAQQTLTNTITSWEEVNESFNDERKVVLNKVYRNTKEILEYIKNQGYNVEISPNLRTGKAVQEVDLKNKSEEIEFIKSSLSKNPKAVHGVLAKHRSYLDESKTAFKNNTNILVMTINEAQGVEFDTVFLVGTNDTSWESANKNVELQKEREKVNRDLMYVALTRAMNELYILRTFA